MKPIDWPLVGLLLPLVILVALARNAAEAKAPANADPDLAPWFQGLTAPSGMSCCAEADGHILADSEWRIIADHYEIKVKGAWVAVPQDRVLDRADNPTGGAVAFYPTPWEEAAPPPVCCFVRPSET
jgi:hypothetical protein